MSSSDRIQVLLRTRPNAPSVAGLPCAVRAAYRAGQELAPERIVIVGADAAFLSRWAAPLSASGAPVLGDRAGAGTLNADLAVLAVDALAFPDEGGLAEFLAAAKPAGAARRPMSGRVVAAYARNGSVFGAGSAAPSDVHSRALSGSSNGISAGTFFDADSPAGADEAARILYSRLSKPNDGYLARFDRRLSLAITRLLLPLPVTPNQVTAASLLLAFLGAWLLAAASARLQFEGALILWFCCLLDGTDGEIARLKHSKTKWGGEFDLLADHLAHFATFVALPIGVSRLHPEGHWRIPGVLLVTGVLASAFSVWRLVLRVPKNKRGPSALVIERIASRDYVYLILALTAIGRLDWFVWAAAIGSHAFCAWIWRASRLIAPNFSASPALLRSNEPS